jgi:thiosulfate/3-mercaptopyruvate sulfurtransferase
MLRWLGHEAVAVLDGGWQKWLNEGRPVRPGREARPHRSFTPHPRPELLADSKEVEEMRLDPTHRLVDVRAAERYHGQIEPIDPVAGHIPGAVNAPYLENLTAEGVFRSPDELRAQYQRLLGDIPSEKAIFYCGSGVTGIHGILALRHAGLGEARLYAGSWSEWIADGVRPVER